MTVYLHDGSPDGFFTAIARALDMPDATAAPYGGPLNLFDTGVECAPDPAASAILLEKTENAAGHQAAADLLYARLSEYPESAAQCVQYLRGLFINGTPHRGNLADPAVLFIRQTRQRVAFEAHRLTGLLRFRRLRDGLYYGPIDPDHNVAALLAPHFARRFGNMRWMIHDTGRGLGVLYDGRHWREAMVTMDGGLKAEHLADGEKEIEDLWRLFFKTIAIPERKNPRLQRQYMPVRYWKYLVEKE